MHFVQVAVKALVITAVGEVARAAEVSATVAKVPATKVSAATMV